MISTPVVKWHLTWPPPAVYLHELTPNTHITLIHGNICQHLTFSENVVQICNTFWSKPNHSPAWGFFPFYWYCHNYQYIRADPNTFWLGQLLRIYLEYSCLKSGYQLQKEYCLYSINGKQRVSWEQSAHALSPFLFECFNYPISVFPLEFFFFRIETMDGYQICLSFYPPHLSLSLLSCLCLGLATEISIKILEYCVVSIECWEGTERKANKEPFKCKWLFCRAERYGQNLSIIACNTLCFLWISWNNVCTKCLIVLSIEWHSYFDNLCKNLNCTFCVINMHSDCSLKDEIVDGCDNLRTIIISASPVPTKEHC